MLDSTQVAPKRRVSRLRSTTGWLLLKAIMALLCAFAAWEILLELTLLKSPRHLVHPELGMIFEQGRYLQGSEGFCNTRINSLGMRYGEIGEKPNDVTRIMVLGDSYAEGFQVADDKTFCALLQQKLAKTTSRKIEVVNAGREGGSPVDYVHLAGFYDQLVHPDLVVVQLNERDFTHDLFTTSQSYYLVEEGSGFTIGAHKALGNPLEEFGRRIPQLAPVMGLSTLRIMAKKAQSALKSGGAEEDEAGEDTPAQLLQRARAIDWVIDRLHAAYPHLVIVFLPTVNYLDIRHDQPSFSEDQLAAACALERIPLISMREDFTGSFMRYHQPANGFFNTAPGSGHINELGHRLTAEKLAVYLEKEIPR